MTSLAARKSPVPIELCSSDAGFSWKLSRAALEKASARQDIADFTRFVAAEMAASAKLKK